MSEQAVFDNLIPDDDFPEGEQMMYALSQVDSLLKASAMTMKAPAPGFASRFMEMKARREAEARRLYTRRVCAIVALVLGLTALAVCIYMLIPGNLALFVHGLSEVFSAVLVFCRKIAILMDVLEKPIRSILIASVIAFAIYFSGLFISALIMHYKRINNGGIAYAENE